MLSCVVAVVTGMLALGSDKRSPEEMTVLREFLPLLQSIAQYERDASVAQSASDAALLLLLQLSDVSTDTLAMQAHEKAPQAGSKSSIKIVFEGQRENLESSSPAIRAYGLHNICHAIRTTKVSINACNGVHQFL
jgi:hypothetical protein